MYIDPDLRDRVYQLFSLEVPKMLQTIETELVTLSFDRSVTKVHNLLRAAHSIKGGAASLGLEAIEDLAHQIENIFRILDHPELPFDRDLDKLLFQLYDCLHRLVTCEINREPLPAGFHTTTQIILAALDDEIGHFVIAGQQTPPDLISGSDLTQSIFDVDIAQSLIRLERVLLDPSGDPIAVGEFRAQAEVFIGISQLLSLPGFSSLAHATIAALDRHPHRSREICCFALVDFYAAVEAISIGDRVNCGRISPGFAFLLAEAPHDFSSTASPLTEADLFDLEHLFAAEDRVSSAPTTGDFDLLDVFDAEDIANRSDLDLTRVSATNFDLLDIFDQVLIDDSAAIDFDLLDIFDPEFSVDFSRSVMSDRAAVNFDLLDIFDLEFSTNLVCSEMAITSIVPDRSLSPNFDLLDIFDLPTPSIDRHAEIRATIANIIQNFDRLLPANPAIFAPPVKSRASVRVKKSRRTPLAGTPQLSVRVAIGRLDRMNNVVGELAIEGHGLTLYNEQVKETLAQLRSKCENFQKIGQKMQQIADNLAMLAPQSLLPGESGLFPFNVDFLSQFDALELDRYSELHSIAQETVEQLAQIEEQIEDLTLFNTQSELRVERQKQAVTNLRDDLMWARMLPLSEILNRFPRTLHDLSIEYQKPVDLKIVGAGVPIDRGTIDKLLDPLLHLLRNAFDHGIDAPDIRRAAGKPERGTIEINAYHQGSQTIIEISDDGGGIDLDRIKIKAVALGLMTAADAATANDNQILDTIFTPGFSTADRITKLSGRGMGLDIVKAQIQTIKGTISIQSELGRGTTFTLRIPLTLTIAQLMICQVGNGVYAFPADSIQRIVVPKATQVTAQDNRRFFHWHDRVLPIYPIEDLLEYSVPIPERAFSHTLKGAVDNPSDWLAPLLIIRIGERSIALQIDRSIAEQELTIVPFGKGITPPSYSYGCTILGDGVMLPVIDLHTLIRVTIDKPHCLLSSRFSPIAPPPVISNLVLVVDDSITTRQSLCLSLEKFGYRTLQARDGQEALQLLRQKTSEIVLVVCDVEMPNMNGFEFLNIHRQDITLTHVPVVMLTSRSNPKHRQFAAHLGAVDYFVKPYIESDFILAIDQLIGHKS